jgi:hypothetical protein
MTVATSEGAGVSKLHIGGVISSAIGTLGRRWLALLLLGLPFVFLPNLLVGLAAPEDILYARLLAGLPPLVFVGGATLITYHDVCTDNPITLRAAVMAGLRRFGSLWLVGFISGLATIGGLVLFVAPGVLITGIFATGAAVVMVEGMSSSGALQRAWDLSRGSRWRLAALLAVAVATVVLALLLISVLGLVTGLVVGVAGTSAATEFFWAPLMVLAFFAITTVGSTAAYVALRRAKEGDLSQTRVFD